MPKGDELAGAGSLKGDLLNILQVGREPVHLG